MFVKVCISFANFCYVCKSMYFLRKFAQYPSNLILPAKDGLFSLNRLSSRGLWKWYDSKVLDRRLYGVGKHFTFCRFSRKRNFFGNFGCDFRKCFTKGFFFWPNMKNFEISVLTANSRHLHVAALKDMVLPASCLLINVKEICESMFAHIRSVAYTKTFGLYILS